MQNEPIDISIVVTVYKKEHYLLDTVRSLTEQRHRLRVEYIFVDDHSPDRSVEVVEAATKDIPNVTIIKNSDNKGPSIRLNQGAQLARGKYILGFDSDDILIGDALARMYSLLEAHHADLLYGRWKRSKHKGSELLGGSVQDGGVNVCDNPLPAVIKKQFKRMTFMVSREVYLRAGGADPRIFIQDESIALRLSYAAKRLIALEAPIMYAPATEGNLSGNKSQLNHDRFLAHYYMLTDHPHMAEYERRELYKRCISAWWKEVRKQHGAISLFTRVFMRYIGNRVFYGAVDSALLAEIKAYFDSLSNIRRVPTL